ncbi:MAG: TonB-dependent receptor [Bacteroidetes bacterium]|nr:TonB-dependent receptor [Bacteroidota bacterium]
MQKFLPLFLLLLSTFVIQAQTGRISGTVLDGKTGETLPGAMVIIEGTTKGAAADFDGKFAINNVPAGKVTLAVSYISYSTKKIADVNVLANDVTDVNIQLETAASSDLQEVEVVVTLNKENNTALVLQQKNNASVSDGISAETIRRTPDKNTSDVLKRVSGASIQDNKFAIVRGLNERYNAAYLNGAPLPSSESDRKAFSFDIFPSNMLDNLVITKTARPDMPGEFAGGIIDISTKSIPEKNFMAVSAQVGYNTLSTFKTQYYYKGGKLDWLGIDDGGRKLPDVVPDIDKFPSGRAAQGQLAKQMPTYDLNIYSKKFAPNQSYQLSGGYNFKLKERDFLGVTAALTYNSTNSLNSALRRVFADNANPNNPSVKEREFSDNTYLNQVLAGALLNLSCKITPNHSVSSKNLVSVNTDNFVLLRTGTFQMNAPGSESVMRENVFWFTSNKIAASQLIGEHYFPKSKLRANWVGAYSKVNRDIPNMRRNIYAKPKEQHLSEDTLYSAVLAPASVGTSYGGGMFWSFLQEDIKSFKADVQRNFKPNQQLSFDLKTGAYAQMRNRGFYTRMLGYTFYGNSSSLLTLPQNEIFAPENMGVAGGFKLSEGTKPRDSYDAAANLYAGYFMADIKYKTWLRAIVGVRVESYYQKMTVPDQLYVLNHIKHTYDTTVIDPLPSLNLIFSPTDKQNIRAGYSRTLNRPEFRELAPFGFYDYNTLFFTAGNPDLQRAVIDNYDVRYEIYPGRGQLFSASGFYKHFTNPIEQVALFNPNELSYGNATSANCYGAELEYRIILGMFLKHKRDSSVFKKVMDNLTFFTNYAYIRSAVDVSNQASRPADAPKTREMQGQSPFIINAGLMYADNEKGFTASAVFNFVGRRIVVVGNYVTQLDIWEKSRALFDLQLSKSFLNKRLEVRLTARDLLAKWQKQYLYNNTDNDTRLDKNKDDVIREIRYGTTYALQFTYRF